MKLRHILIITSFILVNVLIIFALLSGRAKNKTKSTDNAVILTTLKAQKIKNTEERFNIEAYGEVAAYNQIDVSTEVQGKLLKGSKELKPGVKFKKGDLLFKIKDTEAIYNIRARKSGFINMIATILPDINADFPSEYDKWSSYVDAIKLNQTLPVLPAWKSTKEKIYLSNKQVLSEYFTIKSAEEQLTKYYMYAPFSGTIKSVNVNEYAIVNPGSKVMTIVQTSNFEIPLSIPLSQVNDVKVGTKVKLYNTNNNYRTSGKVVRVSDVLDKKTQSITAYVKPNLAKEQPLIEGEYLKAELDLGKAYLGVRIPFNALFDDHMVYVYQNDSTLKPKSIDILNETDKGIFVTGLNDEEIVITQEVFNYTDTTKYKIILK